MSQMRLLAELTDDAVLGAFICSAAFVITYSALARWWRSPIGVSLVTLDTGLALALSPAILHRFFGVPVTSAGFQWFFLVCLCTIAAATAWRTVILAREQLRRRR